MTRSTDDFFNRLPGAGRIRLRLDPVDDLQMNSKEFLRRRKQLMSMVGEGGIAILPAAPIRTSTRDIEHRYRQDSDFYYLTGFAEPGAVAVLAPGRDNGEYLLFCRERDKRKGASGTARAPVPTGPIETYRRR